MYTHWRETTDWGDLRIPNGEYWTNEQGHLVAHKPPNGQFKRFSRPLKRFSKSYRTFTKLGTLAELPEE